MASVASIRLKLLGGFEVQRVAGPVIGLSAKKTRALLAYLTLAVGRAHGRDKLADLLWSDRSDKQARDSLRQAIAELREAFTDCQPAPLATDHELLAVDPAAIEVDALEFERLAVNDNMADLRRAAALYGGELLDGIGVKDPVFEEWLGDRRRHYRDLAISMLKKLLAHERGEATLDVAQRLLALDPLQEEGHQALMRCYAEAGDITAALRQYDVCRTTLKRELDIAPSSGTEALHRQIRNRPIGSSADTSRSAVAAFTSKPSIAVLPFRNLSGDPDQQYFSDGITEDIITELSRFHSLFVIARNSSFQYRGGELELKRIRQELGVRYVIEGSVRRSGDKVRISAQLLDADTGAHLWADRYDRTLQDIFAVQDDVSRMIVATLAIRLEDESLAAAKRKPPERLEVYDIWLRGKQCLDLWTRQGNVDAKALFQTALTIDPDYARAHTGLALAYEWGAWYSAWGGDDPLALETAERHALKAVSLDATDHQPHLALAWIYQNRRDFERCRWHLDRAEALNPNDADMLINKAMILSLHGEVDAALERARLAILLNPNHPNFYLGMQSHCYMMAGRYQEAVALRNRAPSQFPEWHAYTAVLCILTGRLDEARSMIDEFVANFSAHWTGRPTASFLSNLLGYKNQADADRVVEALRKAGLPE
jgi:TolB-like protein/Tfp pilus assembly protein PilF